MPDINGIPYVESTDLVSAYPAVSLALAQELDDQLASKLDYPSGGSDGDALIKDGTDAIWGTAGKIVQVVRDTDTTDRTTTSTSYVDVTGMSVTITPKFSTSTIYVMASIQGRASSSTGTDHFGLFSLTDNSNNALSGNENMQYGLSNFTYSGTALIIVPIFVWGVSTPATTSPVTYKLRFRTTSANTTAQARNGDNTGQIFAIEVAA